MASKGYLEDLPDDRMPTSLEFNNAVRDAFQQARSDTKEFFSRKKVSSGGLKDEIDRLNTKFNIKEMFLEDVIDISEFIIDSYSDQPNSEVLIASAERYLRDGKKALDKIKKDRADVLSRIKKFAAGDKKSYSTTDMLSDLGFTTITDVT